MSELERPVVGEELVRVTFRVWYEDGRRKSRTVPEPAVVTAVARYRVTVKPEGGGLDEYDLRTGQRWNYDRAGATYQGPRLYTKEGWEAYRLETAADAYLNEAGVRPGYFRGSFLKASDGRLLELANLLREFEGLEPIT